MNTKSFFLSLGLFLTMVLASSCTRIYDEPLLNATGPESTLTPNITIKEIKTKYAGTTSEKPLLIEGDYILKARVSGSDESGNIYKTLWIQDETGGMPIAVDMNNISTQYLIGQEILFKLKGLAINYYGLLQIGYYEAGSTNTRIPMELFLTVAEKNGYPDYAKVAPIPAAISQLNDDMIGKVVEFNDVAWKEAGMVFAEKEQTVNRNITDGTKTLLVRNSGYASFANDKLPEGIGTVRGILGKFNNDYQLFLRTKDDVLNFRPGTPSGGTVPPTPGGDTPAPDTPAPSEQGADAILLFPGSDFETDPNVGTYGFTDASIETGVGRDGSKALHIKGDPDKNSFVFSTATKIYVEGATYTKISFWMKGTASGKSLSINVYQADGKVWAYNLGDVTTNVVVSPVKQVSDPVNDYKGSINTNGQWILVTLDITGAQLNHSGSGNTFAIKEGKQAAYDLYIDNIKIE